MLLVWAIVDTALFIASIVQPDLAIWETLNSPVYLLNTGAAILITVSAFRVRRILLDHLAAVGRSNIGISGVATFFFTIYYPQYKTNRFLDSGQLKKPSVSEPLGVHQKIDPTAASCCPMCLSEYRAGFEMCIDCGVELQEFV